MRDFEDHCWKDIVDQDIIEIYEPYRREVAVGRRPAVLAIDLYNKVYQGGSRPVREVNRRYPGSCGEHAWWRWNRRGSSSPPPGSPVFR